MFKIDSYITITKHNISRIVRRIIENQCLVITAPDMWRQGVIIRHDFAVPHSEIRQPV